MNNYKTKFERYLESLEKQLGKAEEKTTENKDKNSEDKEFINLEDYIQLQNKCDDMKAKYKDLSKKYLDLEEKQQTMNFKDTFVNWTIELSTLYVIVALIGVFFCESLSDTLKGLILGSTLVTIIGLPKIIIEGLFKNKDKKDE